MSKSEDSTVSTARHASLAELFRPTEVVKPELPDRLLRYVTEGAGAEILDELERMPDAVTVLGLTFLVGGMLRSAATPRPIDWVGVIEHAAELPVEVLLRLAKVMAAPFGSGQLTMQAGGRTFVHQLFTTLQDLQPPRWLEPLLAAATTPAQGRFTPPYTSSLLSAEIVENLLTADGHSPDLIYGPAFPKKPNDWGTIAIRDYLGGLPGYGARIALRRKLMLEALGDPSAVAQLQALEAFEKLQIPTESYLEPIARLATSTAKTVREAASSLIIRAGEAALPALRPLAESGKSEARSHALRLIARLGSDDGRAYLQERAERETLPAVKIVLSELVGQAKAEEAASCETLPVIDVFKGAALGEETRAAVAKWAKGVAAADLDEAFDWLVDPAPWNGDPRTTLADPAKADVEGLKRLLDRPELTSLHAVRLLRLAGLLQVSPHPVQAGELDHAVPVEIFERLFAAYRDSHAPRMGLRELAAAFRASGLDYDLIARARFAHPWPRRFVWEDEATWPYFADRLDWLAKELDPPPSSRRGWEARLQGVDRRQREALNVLASFPQPPARFIPRLWEIALGTAKEDRPLAQRVLEKLPDCRERVLEALRGGTIDARTAAIEWVVRLRPEGAVDALKAALDSERSAQVKSALVDALASFGSPPEEGKLDHNRARETFRQEAAKGMKGGIPSKYEWFPFDRLPDVRWRGDDAAVDRELISWLIVSAWRTKSPEPSAVLRSHVALLREDDGRGLGKFVFDSWLAEDLRPPTPEELLKRLQPLMQWTGASTIDEIVQKRPEMAQMVEMEKNRPMSVRAEDKGVLAMVAACGPADVVGRIRAYIDQWYGNRAAQCRALVQVLAWIDHPDAIAVLLQVSRRFRTASIRQEAETQVRRLAERKGVSLAELADQALPDAGLDAQGKLVLDFGPRRFVARLGDGADVLLEDESGNSLRALPAPNKSDDPALAAAAKKRLTELKKQVKEIGKNVTLRLYESMCTQRAWKFADWQRTLLHHPIAARLCRRLVWTLEPQTSDATTYRPLDDGTLTDLDDNQVHPEAEAMVRVAHRLTVPEMQPAGWLAHLADYEVASLFAQFTRPVFRLPEEMRSARACPLALDQPLAVQPLSRRARGLGYDPAAFRLQDGGDCFLKHFPGAGLRVEINIADLDAKESATRLELTFHRGAAGSSTEGASLAFALSEIPPVLLSECHADLVSLGGSLATAGQSESLEKE